MNGGDRPHMDGSDPSRPDDAVTIERLERSFARETARAKADLERSTVPLRTPTRLVRRSAPGLPLAIGVLAVVLVVAAVALRGGSQLGNGGVSPIASGSGGTSPQGTVGQATASGGATSTQVPPATPVAPPAGTLNGSPSTQASGSPGTSQAWNSITWSPTSAEPWTGPGNRFVQGVIAWENAFLAVGYEYAKGHAHGVVWRSDDGRSWEREADPGGILDGARLSVVAASGGRLALLGDIGVDPGAGPTGVWTSEDGLTWAQVPATSLPFLGQPVSGITAGPGGFLAYRPDEANHQFQTWTSPDGREWVASEAIPVTALGYGGNVVGTAHGYLAAVRGLEWLSADGRSWTLGAGSNAEDLVGFRVGAAGIVGIVMTMPACSPLCFGVISFPTYRQSTDGINWVDLAGVGPFDGKVGSGLGGQMSSNGSRIVYAAPSGRIWVSQDGLAWHELSEFLADQASLGAVDGLNFGMIAVGSDGLVSIDHDSGDPTVWFGAASAQAPQGPQPTFPLRYNDGRTDRQCIGGEGGDPGVVCIQIGYYLRNDSGSDQLVRMQGAVNSVVRVAAGQTGYLTEIGPVWDSGLPLQVELLTEQCDIVDQVTAKGNLELFTIHSDPAIPLTATTHLPAEALPETHFPTTTTCAG